jgi:hypothetical protein
MQVGFHKIHVPSSAFAAEENPGRVGRGWVCRSVDASGAQREPTPLGLAEAGGVALAGDLAQDGSVERAVGRLAAPARTLAWSTQ